MKSGLIIILCLLNIVESRAQSRSRYEWLWAFGHPVAAIKINYVKKKCDAIYQQIKQTSSFKLQLDSFSNGGKEDAYRHIFYMASFSQRSRVAAVRKLGKAHEKGNYRAFKKGRPEDGEIPDSLSTVMDLYNNEVGISLGKSNKSISRNELSSLVIKLISEGGAKIMKRDKLNNYLRCSGEKVDLKEFEKIWGVPKCLVASDYTY